MINRIREKARKIKLSVYKSFKLIKARKSYDRYYYLSFKVKIKDPNNPHLFVDDNFNMAVPARAAFFAKIKAKKKIRRKIELMFSKCQEMSESEYDEFLNSMVEYKKKELN